MKKTTLLLLVLLLAVFTTACATTTRPSATGASTQKPEPETQPANNEAAATFVLTLGADSATYEAYGCLVEGDIYSMPYSMGLATARLLGMNADGEACTEYGADGFVTVFLSISLLSNVGAKPYESHGTEWWKLPSEYQCCRMTVRILSDFSHPGWHFGFVEAIEPIAVDEIPAEWIPRGKY